MLKQEKRKKRMLNKPVRWYSIRILFWLFVLVLCLIMFMMGFLVSEFLI